MNVGDKVRHSGYVTQQKRDYWLSQGREPAKSNAKRWLDECVAQRGIITAVLHNGYEVQWDDGSVSRCLGYRVMAA